MHRSVAISRLVRPWLMSATISRSRRVNRAASDVTGPAAPEASPLVAGERIGDRLLERHAGPLVARTWSKRPGLRILATSREALGIAGETVWRVPSLNLPESPHHLELVARSEAGRLFVERARAGLPSFELDTHTIRAP